MLVLVFNFKKDPVHVSLVILDCQGGVNVYFVADVFIDIIFTIQ